jgi:hypothetical protein
MRNTDSELYQTVSRFNARNQKDKVPFTIIMTVQASLGTKYSIEAPYKPGRYLRLPYPTQQLLGFRNSLYPLIENQWIAEEEEGDDKFYRSLPLNTNIPLEVVSNPNINKIIYFNQPFGSSIEDLVTSGCIRDFVSIHCRRKSHSNRVRKKRIQNIFFRIEF